MAKVKNKKSINRTKKLVVNKKLNPFEIHLKKEKIRTLEQNSKNNRRSAGQWRATDKHFNKNPYTREKQSNSIPKKIAFDLQDDGFFTHNNQTLSEIEKFENVTFDNENDDPDEETQNLDSNFIAKAHFVDGLLSDTGREGVITHKKFIDELINESKKRKAEQQKIKEQTLELTEKLDGEWKDLVNSMSKGSNNVLLMKMDEKKTEKTKIDNYDKCINELRFEARGTVSDRLKTVAEIAKEEKKKLEQLEREREERMKGIVDNGTIKKIPHRSADDLDDFHIESCSDEEEILNSESETEENEIEKSNDEQSDSESDSLADLKSDETANESNSESDNEAVNVNKRKIAHNTSDDNLMKKSKKNIDELEIDKQNNLPFTFTIPESYEEFVATVEFSSPSQQKLILERMIKCNHSSLAEANKTKLNTLFAFTLQYLNDLFSGKSNLDIIKNDFKIFENVAPVIYHLAELNPENAYKIVSEVIKEKFETFKETKKQNCPGFEVIIFLKLISLLFSTSDFRHQIITPCFIFMEQILQKCSMKSIKNISYGLFVCTLIMEYTAISKRFLPACIHFLTNIVSLATPKNTVNIKGPLKISSSVDLVLKNNCTNTTFDIKLTPSYLIEKSNGKIESSVKISLFHITLNLIRDFMENNKNLPCCKEIIHTILELLKNIDITLYPKEIVNVYQLISNLESVERPKKYLVLEENRQKKALKLYQPKIMQIYDDRHKVKSERRKLVHRLKQETRNTLKCIRKNKTYLSNAKIKEKIESDRERKHKVNQIFNESSLQQKEINALNRIKKRR